MKEVEAREAIVTERERRMKEVFEKEISCDKLILRVGSKRYVVHPSVLTSKKRFIFHRLVESGSEEIFQGWWRRARAS